MKRILFGLVCTVAILFSAQSATAGLIGPFTAIAEGTSSVEGDQLTLDTDIIFQDPDLGLLTYFAELTVVGDDNPFGLTGIFTIGAEDGSLFGVLAGTMFIDEENGLASSAGIFFMISGTGVFEGFTGQGVFTSITNLETGSIVVQLAGVLVPAPGAFAGLAMAGLLTGRRRRRAA